MPVNQRRLSAFLVLARNLNVTRTAREVSLAQSSVSDMMQTLESDLGVTLFHRSNRGISLTPAGEVFRRYAEELLALSDEARAAVQVAAGSMPQELVIGTLETIATTMLGNWLSRFQMAFPDISVRVRIASSAELLRMVLAGEIDMVCSFEQGSDHGKLNIRTVADVQMVLITASADMLPPVVAGLHSLANAKFIVTEQGCIYRRLFQQAFEQAGLATPDQQVEVGSIGMIVSMVTHNAGLAIVPRLAAADAIHRGEVVEIKCAEPLPQVRLGLFWRRRRIQSPAIQTLLDYARSTALSASTAFVSE